LEISSDWTVPAKAVRSTIHRNDMAQIPEDWAQALAELERRRSAGRAMGGAEKLAQRTQAGRRNARELVELLVDEGSFIELGTLVGGYTYRGEVTRPADALVAGMARLDGRSLLIACEDFAWRRWPGRSAARCCSFSTAPVPGPTTHWSATPMQATTCRSWRGSLARFQPSPSC
jgi:predicted nucleic acid-binding protein